MTGIKAKIYLVIILIIIMVFTTGCWDSDELNTLAIVAGVGVDFESADKQFTITYQTIIPSEVKSPSSTGGAGGGESGGQKGGNSLQTVRLDHSTGSTFWQALNRYTQHGSRIPFYQHNQVVVFGKNAVKEKLGILIESMLRSPNTRPNILVAVAEEKASEVLAVQNGMEDIQAIGIANVIKLSANLSMYPEVTFREFVNCFISGTTAAVSPIFEIYEETVAEGKKEKRVRINGTAVFKEDKMIGRLNEQESRGLLWATDEIRRGFLIIPDASLEILKAKSKIIPELKGSEIKVTIEISQDSNLIEYNGRENLDQWLVKQLEEKQAQEIEKQIMAAVNKSFSLNADIFGFGEAVHRKYKREWKDLKPQWNRIYPEIEVSVKAKTHINEIGETNKVIRKD